LLKKVLEVRGAEIIAIDAAEPLKALDSDGQTLFVGGESGIVRMWDIRSGLENQLDNDVKADEPLSCI
jgi:WD40 repeat protein